jgi:hypothetical protein
MVSTPELKKTGQLYYLLYFAKKNNIISYEMKQSEKQKLHILITSLFAG